MRKESNIRRRSSQLVPTFILGEITEPQIFYEGVLRREMIEELIPRENLGRTYHTTGSYVICLLTRKRTFSLRIIPQYLERPPSADDTRASLCPERLDQVFIKTLIIIDEDDVLVHVRNASRLVKPAYAPDIGGGIMVRDAERIFFLLDEGAQICDVLIVVPDVEIEIQILLIFEHVESF